MLLKAAFKHPASLCPYVTLTRSSAKKIIWDPLRELDAKLDLKLKFRENSGDVVLPNKSVIALNGADDRTQIEKLRGPKYPIVVVDEAQGFPPFLKKFIWDVIEPATLDYNGQIVLTGTPNSACSGPFYEFTSGKAPGWSVHKWTLRDNPHVDSAPFLKRLKELNAWDDNHPTYLREYCGKWVRDESNLVFQVNKDRNQVGRFPKDLTNDWDYVLGLDLGYNDPTAFVTLAYSPTLGQCYVVESYKESELIPSAVAARVEALMGRYPYSRIVADTGGFGKGYAEEMKQKFHMPIIAANKTDKLTYLDMMNGDMRSGAIKVCIDNNEELWEEMLLLQWDENKLGRNRYIYDRNFQDHLCDALLYAWRECFHQNLDYDYDAPEYGTKEYWAQEAKKMEDLDVQRFEEEAENPWWLKM